MSNRVRNVLVVIVALVWAANFIAPIFSHDYKPAPELNVAFMAIISALVTGYKRADNGRDNDKDQTP